MNDPVLVVVNGVVHELRDELIDLVSRVIDELLNSLVLYPMGADELVDLVLDLCKHIEERVGIRVGECDNGVDRTDRTDRCYVWSYGHQNLPPYMKPGKNGGMIHGIGSGTIL